MMVKRKELYKMEPPEGGWGILICLGMALGFISPLASMPCFGLLFGDFLKEIGEETSAIALITSAFFCAMSFAGLFTNYLFQKYLIRNIGLIGGFLYFVGNFLQIFVQTKWQLLITFSLFQGIAFGLMVPVSYTTFNNYFVRRRVMMMSFAQSLIGIGTMFYPVIIQQLLDRFGFRGGLAVLAAINSHSIFGMLIMHPVEWHMKKVEINEAELLEIPYKKHLNLSTQKSTLEPLMLNEQSTEMQMLNNRDNQQEEELNSREKLNSETSRKNSINLSKTSEAQINSPRRKSIIPSTDGHHNRGGSATDIVPSLNSNVNVKTIDVVPLGIMHKIVDFLDLTLLKQPIYVNIVLGISFALYSDIAFFTLQPMYLFELGFTKTDTATIIAIGAAADLSSRVFLALSSAFVTIPSRYVYLAGAFFTIIARFAFLHIYDYLGMVIITAVMGFLRTWIHVPLPLVFGEYLPRARFPSGYGLFMFLQGNIMFAIGPIVGYVRDVTNSYPLTFHCITFFMAACAVPWILEIIYLKMIKRQNPNRIHV